MTAMLMYIGTWFLFQLTFIDLHKPEPLKEGATMVNVCDGAFVITGSV